jgi:hypothetical protein
MTSQTVALRYTPRQWAEKVHMAMATNTVVVAVAHRRSGKSTAAAAAVCTAALAKPGRYAIILPTKNHGRMIYWGILKDILADIPGVTFNEGNLSVDFPNGSELLFFGHADGDGASIRGLALSGAVLDEAQLCTEAALAGALRPALVDNNGWLLVIGTPCEPSLLGRLFEYATTAGDPLWTGLHFPISKTGVFTEKQVEQLRAEALSPAIWKQEFECDMTAGDEQQLIPLAAILEATKRKPPARLTQHPAFRDTPRVVAVDVGGDGMEADQSAIQRRWGPLVLEPILVEPEELDQLAFKVAATMRDFSADLLLVDSTGGHASHLMVRMAELGYTPIPVVFSSQSTRSDLHNNKRSEMYAMLAQFTQRPDTILPDDRLLIQELAGIKYRHDTKNRLMLEPKAKLRSKLGRSPDRADALAMTMLAEVMAPRRPGMPAPAPVREAGGARYSSDYRRLQAAPQGYQAYDPSTGRDYDPFTGSYRD